MSFNVRHITGNRESERGQALVEYTLVLMLITFVVIAALEGIGTSVRDALAAAAAGFGGA